MSDARQDLVSLDARVNAALQDYLERLDRGEAVDRERFLAGHPEIAGQLRSFIGDVENLARQAAKPVDASEVSTSQVLSETIAPATPGGTVPLPEIFGRYRVERLVGRGAMGEVYLAHDTQLARQVALKVPAFGDDRSPELLQRFYREARTAAMLRSPHICPVYDVGEIDGRHYISMAFIDGRPLSDVVKNGGRQPERQVLLLVRKLALALQEAHHLGIVHRDLKPGNIMIDSRGEPVITDFGLACRTFGGSARLTLSGVILGSPAYMSPEQLEGDSAKVSPAADQYSLGVVMYELLTGELPFRGSIPAVIGQIVSRPAPSPRSLRPEIDPRVEALCLKMLAKSPGERFESMRGLAERIAEIVRDPLRSPAQTPPPAANVPPSANIPPAATETVPPMKANVQRQVAGLIQRGELKAALNLLEPLAGQKAGKLGEWARQQQVQLRVQLEHRKSAPALCHTARKLIEQHDYAEARRILTAIPAVARTDELKALLREAEDKDEEADLLLLEIETAIRKNKPDQLPGLVQRFLHLRPAHRDVLNLAGFLEKYGAERIIPVRQRRPNVFDPVGPVWNRWHVAGYVVGLAALCTAVYLGAIAFQTPHGTVIVEVHDPRVTVSFAGDAITANSSGKKFRLTPTDKKTLQLEIDGVLVDASTQEITVDRNETKIITARLVDGQLDLAISRETKRFPVPQAVADDSKSGHSAENKVDATVQWIDLMAGIDTGKMSKGPKQRWSRRDNLIVGTLVESETGWVTMIFPQEAAGDYDLEVDCLAADTDYLSLALPLNETLVSISFFEGGTGLQWIDGKDIDWKGQIEPHGNSQLRPETGVVNHVTASVRHYGENVTVETFLNGVAAGRYSGLRSRLSIPKSSYPAFGRFKIVAPFHHKSVDRRIEIHKARVRFLNPRPATAPIPADATVFSGHAYKFFPEKLSWSLARQRCEALGGHLPVVDNQAENDFLVELCRGKFPPSTKLGGATIWLGISDAAKEGDWKSLGGESPAYTNWYGKQPNNGGGSGENYATMLLTALPVANARAGQWSDQPDASTQQDVYLVCEWDALPANSPAVAGTAPVAPTAVASTPAGSPDKTRSESAPRGTVLLDVDFRKTSGGFSLGDWDHLLAEHKDGEYRYLGKLPGWWCGGLESAFWSPQNNQLRDFIFEVDVRLLGNKKGVFAIEFGRMGDSTLSLCLNQAGQMLLLRDVQELVPATSSPAIRPVDQFNTLRLEVENKTVRALANGKLVFEKRLDRYAGGPVWLWLGPEEIPFDSRIRRVRIERLGDPPHNDHEIRRFKGHTDIVRAVAFLPEGKQAVSVGHDNAFKLWDVTTGALLHDFEGHPDKVTSVSVSADGRRALTGCFDGQVRLWDLENRTLLKTLKGHPDRVTSVLLSRDGLTGLSLSLDGMIRQWDFKSGNKPKVLPVPAPGGVLALSHAENAVASSNSDGLIALRSPQAVAVLTGHAPGLVEGLAFLPDGSKLVSGGDDGTIRLWNLHDGKEVHRFETDGVGFDTVAVTSDGRYVVAGCGDHTILGWDLQTGDKVCRFHADMPVTHRLALSPDNQYVLTGGGDFAWKPTGDFDLRLWKLPAPPAPKSP